MRPLLALAAGLLAGVAMSAPPPRPRPLKLPQALPGHAESVRTVAFSPDGKTLASADDGALVLWDLRSGRHTSTPMANVASLRFSPDGKTLATSGRGTIRLWDVQTGEPRRVVKPTARGTDWRALMRLELGALSRPPEPISLKEATDADDSFAFSPDGRTIVSASSRAVRLWDQRAGRLRRDLRAHEGSVKAVAFTPDGKSVLSAGIDGTVRRWDAASGAQKAVLLEKPGLCSFATRVVFSPDGKTLACAHIDGEVRLWDLATGRPKGTPLAVDEQIYGLAFSPDSKTVAAGGMGGEVKLWDVATARLQATLQGHELSVGCLAFSPDGGVLASGSADTTVRLWPVKTP